jgi:hypothetical protein
MEQYFLSYSTRDASEFATRLRLALETGPAPVKIWRDTDGLPAGDSWERGLNTAIDESDALLFVMTGDSIREECICANELERARQCKKTIIPLRVESIDPVKVPLLINKLPVVDFTRGFEAGWRTSGGNCGGGSRQRDGSTNACAVWPAPAVTWRAVAIAASGGASSRRSSNSSGNRKTCDCSWTRREPTRSSTRASTTRWCSSSRSGLGRARDGTFGSSTGHLKSRRTPSRTDRRRPSSWRISCETRRRDWS